MGVQAVLAAAPPGSVPRSENIGVNAPVLFFTPGVSVIVGIVVGVIRA
jgi:hypothetical protein